MIECFDGVTGLVLILGVNKRNEPCGEFVAYWGDAQAVEDALGALGAAGAVTHVFYNLESLAKHGLKVVEVASE